ncbi:hypothetical protein Cni_G05281 [Canna indica]|uniref:Uncharacterized protein n=1 Tax=Canna indica TaxID=4628 RepID=A0AAQ3JUG4_9LILI|nr:hypothetical protein Cni_G05281 [Canna indica]
MAVQRATRVLHFRRPYNSRGFLLLMAIHSSPEATNEDVHLRAPLMASESIPASGDAAAEDGAGTEAASPVGGGRGRGWAETARRVGEKVVLASAAVVAAPVVIPSYCVASTLGLALAVPFAAYVATIAATEKVMSSLLPPPASPFSPGDLEVKLNEKKEEKGGGGNTNPSAEAATESSIASTDYTSAAEENEEEDQDLGNVAAATGVKTPPVHEVERIIMDVIWGEISALRIVMGYTAALRQSTVEELRALYLFAGVEPPLSLEDPCSVMEIKDKLHFLKLLLGVQ